MPSNLQPVKGLDTQPHYFFQSLIKNGADLWLASAEIIYNNVTVDADFVRS